mmetsp:Transcript_47755/g.103520  ORF Transcript_47755/g.103520 Transcript_47755/m.103520 type:complete len:460 (-) Transcript_47755:291-1670(-)
MDQRVSHGAVKVSCSRRHDPCAQVLIERDCAMQPILWMLDHGNHLRENRVSFIPHTHAQSLSTFLFPALHLSVVRTNDLVPERDQPLAQQLLRCHEGRLHRRLEKVFKELGRVHECQVKRGDLAQAKRLHLRGDTDEGDAKREQVHLGTLHRLDQDPAHLFRQQRRRERDDGLHDGAAQVHQYEGYLAQEGAELLGRDSLEWRNERGGETVDRISRTPTRRVERAEQLHRGCEQDFLQRQQAVFDGPRSQAQQLWDLLEREDLQVEHVLLDLLAQVPFEEEGPRDGRSSHRDWEHAFECGLCAKQSERGGDADRRREDGAGRFPPRRLALVGRELVRAEEGLEPEGGDEGVTHVIGHVLCKLGRALVPLLALLSHRVRRADDAARRLARLQTDGESRQRAHETPRSRQRDVHANECERDDNTLPHDHRSTREAAELADRGKGKRTQQRCLNKESELCSV